MKLPESLVFIDQHRTHADDSLADSVSAMIGLIANHFGSAEHQLLLLPAG